MRRFLPTFSPKKIINPRVYQPSALSGLALWLDPSAGVTTVDIPAWVTSTVYDVGTRVVQSATYYKCATAHTSGTFADDLAAVKWVATTDGAVSVISRWVDQSGNARNATNTDIYKTSPALVPLGLNSRPIARFDGSNDYLTGTLNGSGLDNLTGWTVFMVFSQLPVDNKSLLVIGTNTKWLLNTYYQATGGARYYSYLSTGQGYSECLESFNSHHISSQVFNGSQATDATRFERYHDGTKLTLTFHGSISSVSDNSLAAYYLGRGVGDFGGGDIAEIILYNRALSILERSQIEYYLSDKYAITVSTVAPASPLALHLDATKGVISTESAYPVNAPTDLANCALWLDANNTASITKDGSNKVSAWNDLSGNVRHAVQNTADYQPLWVASGLNSKPVLRFDGSNDCLTNNAVTGLDILTGATVFVVGKSSTVAVGSFFSFSQRIMMLDGGLNNNTLTTSVLNNDTSLASFSITIAQTTNQIMVSRYDGTGVGNAGRLKIYMNGTDTSGTYSGVDVATSLWYITYYNIGKGYVDWHYLTGDIAEIIIYSAALTDTQRKSVELYLAYKYGIACQMGQVTTWNDQSGNSRNASQTTLAYKPAYVVNALNKRPALQFDGINDVLSNTFITPITTPTGLTVFVVFCFNSLVGYRAPFGLRGATVETCMTPMSDSSTTIYWYQSSVGAYSRYVKTLSINTPYLYSAVYNGNLTGHARFVAYDAGSLQTLIYDLTPAETAISIVGVEIGTMAAYYGACNVYELIVFNRALISAERHQIELYLSRKWGIATSS